MLPLHRTPSEVSAGSQGFYFNASRSWASSIQLRSGSSPVSETSSPTYGPDAPVALFRSTNDSWVIVDDNESREVFASTPTKLLHSAAHNLRSVTQIVSDLTEETVARVASSLHRYRLRRRNAHSDPDLLADHYVTMSTYTGSCSSSFSLDIERDAACGKDAIAEMLEQRRLIQERKGFRNWLRFEPTLRRRQLPRLGDEEKEEGLKKVEQWMEGKGDVGKEPGTSEVEGQRVKAFEWELKRGESSS